MTSWLNLAYRTTKKSTHPRQQMAALVVSGGRVLGLAANRRGGHAEQRAIAQARGTCHGATMFVVRANRGISRPCPNCRQAIQDAGIAKVVYVDLNGNVEVDKL